MKPAPDTPQVSQAEPCVKQPGQQHDPPVPLARLLIHAGDTASADGNHFESALRRLRSLYPSNRGQHASLALQVQIDDIQGRCLYVNNAAGPLTDLPLPAGTYQVTAHCGKICRSYTMTLEQGRSFDLYLRLAPPSRS